MIDPLDGSDRSETLGTTRVQAAQDVRSEDADAVRESTDAARESSESADAAREAALRLLERTRRTRTDLERRLRDRGHGDGVIASVLDRLTRVGLVDDVEYARAFLAGRWGRRASGWRVLEQDLRRRGVSPSDILVARERLEAEQGQQDEVSLARRVLQQTARRYASLDPRTKRQRLWALLARRGFDGDVIAQAMSEESAANSGR